MSEFQDSLRGLMELHDQAMQGALGIPAHLMEMDLTQSNFDYAKLEKRLMDERERKAESDRLARLKRLFYGDKA